MTEKGTYPGSFMSIPEEWKEPKGPYRQAPAEHGGEWWLKSPFNSKPWLSIVREAAPLPVGFEALFGKRPDARDYPTPESSRIDKMRWEKRLEDFVSISSPSEFGLAEEDPGVYVAWGMGSPVYYVSKNGGLRARFVNVSKSFYRTSASLTFDLTGEQVASDPHLMVALFQVHALVSAKRAGEDVKLSDVASIVHPLLISSGL